ncbi:MAG: hypothetical protein K8S98_08360 [Planctomycetes bacterium]|nr:hypothetical protein [Planctomycetota bacterium]
MFSSLQSRLLAGATIGSLVVASASAQNHPSTTFFGGNAHDRVQGCSVDSQGRILVTGNTGSTDLAASLSASKGGYQKTFKGGSDAFIGILSADLSTVIAWTYLGGKVDERGYGVAADSQGRVWVVGFTESNDFPVTNGSKWKGLKDVFVARFSPDLKQLQMSTYIGGSDEENPRGAFAIDAAGNFYLGGATASLNFPTTAGVFQTQHAGGPVGSWDGFVTKLNSSGAVVWSTFLGGTGDDASYSGLQIASDGSIVVAGMTNSTNFPVTAGAFQTTYGGDSALGSYVGDGFVTRLTGDGKKLVYSTFLGGSDDDAVSGNDALALDDYDNAIVIGQARSMDFPMPSGGWMPQHTAGISRDGFAVRLSADGSQLQAGTFIGGGDDDELSGLDIDASGNVYISGDTTSGNFPTTLDATQPNYAGNIDAVIVKLSADFAELLYGTYVGGTGNVTGVSYGDRGRTLQLTAQNKVVFSGDADSTDFPTTPGTFDPIYDGGTSDGFVSTLSLGDTYVLGKGKVTTLAKFATLGWKGTPSIAGQNFSIEVKNAVPKMRGMMLWGPAIVSLPFSGGTLYPETPWTRLPTKTLDATGFLKFQIALDATMIGETRVYQFLFEDPTQPDGTRTAMSNALKVVFTP